LFHTKTKRFFINQLALIESVKMAIDAGRASWVPRSPAAVGIADHRFG
jgi:hypothetical protein